MLGYLMYRSALVPRLMAVVGLIGGTLATATAIAVLFVQALRANLRVVSDRDTPGIHLGGDAWHLAHS
jgi:TRAP-type mannitol/chloroaromatic compound transport system permease large subunit